MRIEQRPTGQQTQNQKLVMSPQMRRSLEILKMPAQELCTHIGEQLNENPLLEIDESAVPLLPDDPFAILPLPKDTEDGQTVPEMEWSEYNFRPRGGGTYDLEALLGTEEASFTSLLLEQLGTLPLEKDFYALCEYCVECLDESGYFLFSLEEIAADTGTTVFEVAQALYAVQSLQPTGVGARTLQECLILQLAESKQFTHYTIQIVKEGLPLLAANNIAALARLLNCSPATAKESAAAIRALNPIPSRGYYTGESVQHIIPDAVIERVGQRIRILLNDRISSQLILSRENSALLSQNPDVATRKYLTEKLEGANSLLQAIHDRNTTLQKVLRTVVEMQPAYFKGGAALHPMTLAQVAQRLELHVSTISRAVQGKYIVCTAGTVPLKSLFTTAVPTAAGDAVSAETARLQLKRFIEAEDPAHPLSDQNLQQALLAANISISRRTVAKYREEMGIADSRGRRREPE